MVAFTSFDSSVKISKVELSDVQMRVAQVGQGPDIVWIPGGDSPAEAWQKQMLNFADRFRSTSYDPRGIGETMSAPAPWSIGDFACDCAELIEKICNPPVVVAGVPGTVYLIITTF